MKLRIRARAYLCLCAFACVCIRVSVCVYLLSGGAPAQALHKPRGAAAVPFELLEYLGGLLLGAAKRQDNSMR